MPTWLKHFWHTRRLSALLVIALVAVAVIVALLWPITDLIAAHDVGWVTGPLRVQRLQTARDAARGRLLQLGAGLFAAAALVYTARNFSLSREGQVTDRYTKAVEQLGSDTIDVTIGGIYALERIARDSPRDHPTVMAVLAACIRENSHKDGQQAEPGTDIPGQDRPTRAIRADIQAALTVIVRRDTTHDSGPPIDLTGAYLARAFLYSPTLARPTLARASLAGASLAGAYLYRADLAGAYLFLADLAGATLGGASLAGATFVDADLTDATLIRADLTNANLSGANLTNANLVGANLAGATLTNATIANATLANALYPLDMAVPVGWVRDADSGRLKRANYDPDWDPSDDGPTSSDQPGTDAA